MAKNIKASGSFFFPIFNLCPLTHLKGDNLYKVDNPTVVDAFLTIIQI